MVEQFKTFQSRFERENEVLIKRLHVDNRSLAMMVRNISTKTSNRIIRLEVFAADDLADSGLLVGVRHHAASCRIMMMTHHHDRRSRRIIIMSS